MLVTQTSGGPISAVSKPAVSELEISQSIAGRQRIMQKSLEIFKNGNFCKN